jgi:phage shock protein A
MTGAFREQERRYNELVRERAALMEEHQRSKALRAANEARASISLTDSSRDLEKARQAIRQASFEAQAVGELGTSETERQVAAAEIDLKRLDAERELEMMEVQMGLRPAASIEEGGDDFAHETEGAPVERLDERRADRDEGGV